MNFTLHRLKKRVLAFISRTSEWAQFIGVVLICGIGSAWYMIDNGTSWTTVSSGPWVMWPAAGREDADPYTRAHFTRLGAVPVNAEFAPTFIAWNDSDGRSLHATCEYELVGADLPTHWWSVSVFDSRGRPIPNLAGRFSLTSTTTMRKPDGGFRINLARDAKEGNWLPIGGGGRLVIAFSLIDLGIRSVARYEDVMKALPTITRKDC